MTQETYHTKMHITIQLSKKKNAINIVKVDLIEQILIALKNIS